MNHMREWVAWRLDGERACDMETVDPFFGNHGRHLSAIGCQRGCAFIGESRNRENAWLDREWTRALLLARLAEFGMTEGDVG